jgi:Kef-type K+ transport system membrane component KefB
MAPLQPHTLTVLGLLLLAGYAAHAAGACTHIPRVTLLLLVGLAAGPYCLDLIPPEAADWFPLVAHMALAMIGFLLGERLLGRDIEASGRIVLWVSIIQTLVVAIFVLTVLWAIGASPLVALLLAGIAPASAPAATVDVIRESKARGPLTDTVLGVVAIDDAWGILLFSLLLVLVEGAMGFNRPLQELLLGGWEIGGACLLGILLGFPMAWLTGRLKSGEPTLLEASGFVFLCAGLAMLLQASYLLACMFLGATVAHRAIHHTRPFREIEGISEPFLVIFFLLAGYRFEVEALSQVGGVIFFYVLARAVGKVVGGRLGARFGGAPPVIEKRIGWCLLPQAGVALGLALLVCERIPQLGTVILPMVIAATILFELVGPVFTRWHLQRAGEIPGSRGQRPPEKTGGGPAA